MRPWALRHIGLLVIVALVLLGEGSPGYAASASGAARSGSIQAGPVRYDGETILKGLAFGQGPVARLFPELASTPPLSAQAAAAVDMIIAQMRAFDPGFFARFAAATYSGSRVRARAALENANELGKRSILAINARYSSAAVSPEDGACLATVAAVLAAVAVAVVLVAAVVVLAAGAAVAAGAVAVVVVAWFWVWLWRAPTPAEAQQASLTRDIWADKIARAMRASS